MIRRDETFAVHLNYGQYYLADPDRYPGMGGPNPEEFPDFASPGPLRRLQSAEGLVFIAARTHTGTVAVRYLLADEQPEPSPEHPELLGELTATFPTGRAELRGLMDGAATDTSLLEGRPGAYAIRLESTPDGSTQEGHRLAVWPRDGSRLSK